MQKSSGRLFIIGVLSAVGISAIASVPRYSVNPSGAHDSIAIQEEVSEIRVQRQAELKTDQDMDRLSRLQGRYKENLPLMKRNARVSSAKGSVRRTKRVQTAKRNPQRVSPQRAEVLRIHQAAPNRAKAVSRNSVRKVTRQATQN